MRNKVSFSTAALLLSKVMAQLIQYAVIAVPDHSFRIELCAGKKLVEVNERAAKS